MSEKILWEGFGFPVILSGVSWVETPHGYKTLDIDMEKFEMLVCEALLVKPSPLTGAEVRFLRNSFHLTQDGFASLAGLTSHTVVVNWEKRGHKPSGMEVNTELLLRLRLASERDIKKFEIVLHKIVLPGKLETNDQDHPIEVAAA